MSFALDCIDLLKDKVLNSSELQVFYPLIQCYPLVSELGSEGAGELGWCQVQLKSSLPGSHNGWAGTAQCEFCYLHSECSHIFLGEVQNPGILSQWTSHASFVIEGMSTFSRVTHRSTSIEAHLAASYFKELLLGPPAHWILPAGALATCLISSCLYPHTSVLPLQSPGTHDYLLFQSHPCTLKAEWCRAEYLLWVPPHI